MVLHQCPFEPFGAGSALFCVFDGHSGSQAAQKAKAIVPGLLGEKLKVGTGDRAFSRTDSNSNVALILTCPDLRDTQPKEGGALISGRPDAFQRQLLKEVFLEADSQIATDEGCTATVVLMELGSRGQLMVQVWMQCFLKGWHIHDKKGLIWPSARPMAHILSNTLAFCYPTLWPSAIQRRRPTWATPVLLS